MKGLRAEKRALQAEALQIEQEIRAARELEELRKKKRKKR
jgi:hypothetical protein